MQKEEIKFVDSTVFEGMTSIRAIIKGIDLGINNRKIIRILYDKSKIKKIGKEIGYLKAVASTYGFSVLESDEDYLSKITLGNSHGGLIAITGDREIPEIDANFCPNGEFYAMIQGIEDPYNFGYSLRSLYAMGCSGIILSPRNWMSAAGVVSRSSAGASEQFEIFTANDSIDAVKRFKECGFQVVCADENTDTILGSCDLKYPLLLIVGGEKRGISASLLELADIRVRINYGREFNASLSAASATTMFAYEILRQNS